ncbi:type III-A CRISPR-associated RAMP protein Csm3 [Cuniculiplasma sp. SKW4]|uniref:type III-A CRISPR-associated RAMP protein Csm3 n=1 Tax=Cuniculiplasma sp. SKW4 TaxID=3400171 RepID=UPI003FCFEE14
MKNTGVFKKNIIYSGKIRVLTGLHIGGGNETVKIGGTDNSVAKTIIWEKGKKLEVPYIPGSSLKGKIRNLLSSYVISSTTEENKERINKIFGTSENNIQTSRVIFRDCFPSENTISLFMEQYGLDLTEIKSENRIKPDMVADPRFIERVRPSTEFDFECILTIYEGDDENMMKKTLEDGFRLLEQSYLGGNGTRGYGKVKIDYNLHERNLDDYIKKENM